MITYPGRLSGVFTMALCACVAGFAGAMPARAAEPAPAAKTPAEAAAEAGVNLDALSLADLKARDAQLVADMDAQAKLIQATHTRLAAARHELLKIDEVQAIQKEINALRQKIVEVVDRQPPVVEAQKTIAGAQKAMQEDMQKRRLVQQAISKKPAEVKSEEPVESAPASDASAPEAPASEKKD